MKGARKTVLTFGEDFGLVQIPVAVAPVSGTKTDVKTELVAPSGVKTAKRTVDPETGKEVASEDVRRGIPNGDGYAFIDEDDWKAITDETKPTEMEVVEFVKASNELVKARLSVATDAHFVQPQDGAAGSLAVLLDAMRKNKRVAVVRWGAGSRQRLGILQVRDDRALVVQTVPFAADIAEPDDEVLAPSEVKVTAKAAKLGKQLVERLDGDGSTLATAEDEAVSRRRELVDALLSGQKPERSEKSKPKATKDVEAALEAALA